MMTNNVLISSLAKHETMALCLRELNAPLPSVKNEERLTRKVAGELVRRGLDVADVRAKAREMLCSMYEKVRSSA